MLINENLFYVKIKLLDLFLIECNCKFTFREIHLLFSNDSHTIDHIDWMTNIEKWNQYQYHREELLFSHLIMVSSFFSRKKTEYVCNSLRQRDLNIVLHWNQLNNELL